MENTKPTVDFGYNKREVKVQLLLQHNAKQKY